MVRQEVPAGFIDWSIGFDTYDPISFTAPFVLTAPWADPVLGADGFKPEWNKVDGKINRASYEGEYKVGSKIGGEKEKPILYLLRPIFFS